MTNQKQRFLGYNVINVKGKQMVNIPTVYNFEQRIKRIENFINTINKISLKVEEVVFFFSISVLTYNIMDLIFKK